MKKTAVILALITAFICIPFVSDGKVSAKETPAGLVYELNADGQGYAVIGANGVIADMLVIPATYNSLPVTEISDDAFYGCNSVKKAVIGASVKSIGERAFAFCENLQSVTFNTGLKIIDNFAFYACKRLKTVFVPYSVNVLGVNSFAGCSALRGLTYEGTYEEFFEIIYYSFARSSLECDMFRQVIIDWSSLPLICSDWTNMV